MTTSTWRFLAPINQISLKCSQEYFRPLEAIISCCDDQFHCCKNVGGKHSSKFNWECYKFTFKSSLNTLKCRVEVMGNVIFKIKMNIEKKKINVFIHNTPKSYLQHIICISICSQKSVLYFSMGKQLV